MNKSLVIALFLLCTFCGASGQATRTAPAQFGRAWWMTISNSNGSGFVDGYKDGLPPGPLWKLPGWNVSSDDLSSLITDFYTRHSHNRRNAGHVLLHIAATIHGRPPQPGGEIWSNRHGYYNGLWWKQSRGDEQLGYVEGYLLCLGHPTSVSEARKLATAITAWYHTHPSREDRSIAYVLTNQLKSRLKERPEP